MPYYFDGCEAQLERSKFKKGIQSLMNDRFGRCVVLGLFI